MTSKPPQIIRRPSNGIASACMAGSIMAFFTPSFLTVRDGQTTHEKTTVSSFLRITAACMEFVSPSGTSSPQASTTDNAPCFFEHGGGDSAVLAIGFLVRRGHGANHSVDVGHARRSFLAPARSGARPHRACPPGGEGNHNRAGRGGPPRRPLARSPNDGGR